MLFRDQPPPTSSWSRFILIATYKSLSELYGCVSSPGGEWVDGIFTSAFRKAHKVRRLYMPRQFINNEKSKEIHDALHQPHSQAAWSTYRTFLRAVKLSGNLGMRLQDCISSFSYLNACIGSTCILLSFWAVHQHILGRSNAIIECFPL